MQRDEDRAQQNVTFGFYSIAIDDRKDIATFSRLGPSPRRLYSNDSTSHMPRHKRGDVEALIYKNAASGPHRSATDPVFLYTVPVNRLFSMTQPVVTGTVIATMA